MPRCCTITSACRGRRRSSSPAACTPWRSWPRPAWPTGSPSAARLRAAAGELLAGLRELTPQVIAAQKALFETWLNTGLQAGIDASVEVFAGLFADPATTAAIAAYQRQLAGRQPRAAGGPGTQ